MPPSISPPPLFKALCIAFKDKKAYIKRRICSFLVKRAVVAYGREVGALGRLFPTQSTLYIPPPHPLIVLYMSSKDKKAYIKRRTCSFLVKRAVVAHSREVGALGRLFKPHSGSQPRLGPFLRSEMIVLRYFGLELLFPTIKRDQVMVGSQSKACFGYRQ
jgi:hypothetical protein